MYSAAIILTLISVANAASFVPSYLGDKEMPKSQPVINSATYTSGQNDHPSSLHVYPTYPVYLNNNHVTLHAEDENHPISTTTAVQKVFQWSYTNIVSNLIRFTTNLYTYGTGVGKFLLRFWMVILLGVVSASMICMQTSICNTYFPGKIEIKELAKIYITPENLDYFTAMIFKALDKYGYMQEEKNKDDAKQNKSQEENAKDLADETKTQ